MIGPEDIQQTPKPNYTPIIILGVAAVLLLIVGFISYRDYVNAKADEKVDSKVEQIRKELEAQIALRESNKANLSSSVPSAPNTGVAQPPAPPQKDPEIEELRRQLAAMKKLQEENSMKVEKVLSRGPIDPKPYEVAPIGVPSTGGNNNGRFNPEPAPIGGPPIEDKIEVPNFVKDSVSSPPGGMSPEAQARIAAFRRNVMNSPAIGKVLTYDSEWGFVTIDAGTSNGIRKGGRFSVRRGGDILGDIRLEQVDATESLGVFTTKGRKVEVQPRKGDDIIASQSF